MVLCLGTVEEVVLSFNTAGLIWTLGMFAELVTQRSCCFRTRSGFELISIIPRCLMTAIHETVGPEKHVLRASRLSHVGVTQ